MDFFGSPDIVFSVDKKERFGVMELPYYLTELREEDMITSATYLINLGESLSLVGLHGDYFDIWAWKEASWVLIARRNMRNVQMEHVPWGIYFLQV